MTRAAGSGHCRLTSPPLSTSLSRAAQLLRLERLRSGPKPHRSRSKSSCCICRKGILRNMVAAFGSIQDTVCALAPAARATRSPRAPQQRLLSPLSLLDRLPPRRLPRRPLRHPLHHPLGRPAHHLQCRRRPRHPPHHPPLHPSTTSGGAQIRMVHGMTSVAGKEPRITTRAKPTKLRSRVELTSKWVIRGRAVALMARARHPSPSLIACSCSAWPIIPTMAKLRRLLLATANASALARDASAICPRRRHRLFLLPRPAHLRRPQIRPPPRTHPLRRHFRQVR